MPDLVFSEPRLAAIYDALDGERDDLDVYTEIILDELCARSVLDVGCGTGSFPIRLVAEAERRGIAISVIGLDPAAASLDIARTKAGMEHVRWIEGRATDAASGRRPIVVDVAVMTGNVAQVFVGDAAWNDNLAAIRSMLDEGGHVVFEARDPTRRWWTHWNRSETHAVTEVDGVGAVEHWKEVIDVALPLVTFQSEFRFIRTGESFTSVSTLRFRSREELASSLEGAGFEVLDVRDAPDRVGKEFVFVAERR